MKLNATLILYFSVLMFNAAGAEKVVEPVAIDWRIIASSHFVVEGVMDVPKALIEQAIRSNEHQYVDIPFAIVKVYKGKISQKSINVRYYTKPSEHQPSFEALIGNSRQSSLIFLVYIDNNYYFISIPQAMQVRSDALCRSVQKEIGTQQLILRNITQHTPNKVSKRVKKLIDSMASKKNKGESAFKELMKMESEDVPSIILLMDDYRPLVFDNVEVPSRGWEGIAHYGPVLVVDALAIILPAITNESFGQIYNGGSALERQQVIDAWRIYLYHQNRERPNSSNAD